MALLSKWGFKYSSSSYDNHIIKNIEDIEEIPISTISYSRKERNTDYNEEFPKQLTLKLLSKKIPFGSGLFVSFFGSRISFFIKLLNKSNKPAILFIHNWQLYRPEMLRSISFKLKALRYSPFNLLYMRNILKPLEKLLASHQFTTFKDCFYGQ